MQNQSTFRVESHSQILLRGARFTVLVFVITIVMQWLVYDLVLQDPGGLRLIAPVVASLACGAFVISAKLHAVANNWRFPSGSVSSRNESPRPKFPPSNYLSRIRKPRKVVPRDKGCYGTYRLDATRIRTKLSNRFIVVG